MTAVADVPAANAAPAPTTNAPAATPGNAAPTSAPAADEGKGTEAAPSLIAAAQKAAATTTGPDYSGIKAEGLRDGTLKAFTAALGEHKIDPKAGQAVLDKVLAAVKEGDAAAEKALLKKWDDELAKDPDFAADKRDATLKSIGGVLSLASKEDLAQMQEYGVDRLPAFARLMKRVGGLLSKATATDSTATGTSTAEMTEMERYRASNPKTYAGLRELGVNVN